MRRFIPRLLLLAVFGGGLLIWSQLRRPRDLKISLDLTGALPGEVKDLDVIVRRGGHALARHFVRYGAAGAPGTVEFVVFAAPGNAEVETTLAYREKPSRRSVARVELSAEDAAKVSAQ
ncbi:MAG: hypothetical protein E6J65_06070 [Deltaproteobacteria bacterium]|nr:MAG: hypothetical protein E6J65_06070 [Deltaproteobacteria bacterium]